jgi:hypothetical protein
MKKLLGFFLVLSVLSSCNQAPDQSMDLSGEWKVRLDRKDQGVSEEWFNDKLEESVFLPGSLAENGLGDDISVNTVWTSNIIDSSWYWSEKYAPYREDGNIKIPFWLQPEKRFVGAAWFQKEVRIPKSWSRKHVVLCLERPHWETRVWIDDQEIGKQNTLGTPHSYPLTGLIDPGQHTITIRIDNRIKDINPGVNSHSIADHTQSNWNGLVGNLNLQVSPLVYIDRVSLFPDVEQKLVRAQVEVRNLSGKGQACSLKLQANGGGLEGKLEELGQKFSVEDTEDPHVIEITYPMGDSPALWDEFNPELYTMVLTLSSPEGSDSRKIQFGMREFKAKGKRFSINGRPLFLRGTLECAIFPRTGYPPTDTESWLKIMQAVRAHGLNHIRFHSWCPPEAAFCAADEMGVYLHVECSSWANQGATLGDNRPIDSWLLNEAESILASYGNHPSFCMMAYGNEPGGSRQLQYLENFVTHFRKKDPRRVYTSGAGWPYLDSADFFSDPRGRIQRWGEGLRSIINQQAPQTTFDFRDIVEPVPMPYVSHEIGQWCVYPNFREIEKYDGVLKARNFEIFRETLEKQDLAHLADSFLIASGKLQALCYKADIEAALRTPEMAGFQLLDLHDFPGQGTALVGVLDPFWEEKGYITPEQYSNFCNVTVPLARMNKRVYSTNESFEADLEVAHFGSRTLQDPEIRWKISSEEGTVVEEGGFQVNTLQLDNNQQLGSIRFPLNGITGPVKLNLELSVDQYSNDWDFWVYPENLPDLQAENIHITGTLDQAALEVLKEGGKVLWTLRPNSLTDAFGGNIALGFSSIFWNTAWTRGQAPHTLGILCNPAHPALASFPTEYHSNWQWWDALHFGQAIRLDAFEEHIKPIVRIIDDWFENRSLGLIFEAKAGNGKILVCGTDLLTKQEDRLEARQLLFSLINYMNTSLFNPGTEVSMDELLNMTN